jgi:hypothetical protein
LKRLSPQSAQRTQKYRNQNVGSKILAAEKHIS